MVEYIHIMVHCPYIGCPRSIEYCFNCEHKKGIADYDLICDYRDSTKKLEKDKGNINNKNREMNK